MPQDWFGMLPLDTQEVEGANSIIKRLHHLAPNIKLPLMSDRVLIKKCLGAPILSKGKQARLDAIHFAVENHQGALQQFGQIKSRFSCATSDLVPSTTGVETQVENPQPIADAPGEREVGDMQKEPRKRGRPKKNAAPGGDCVEQDSWLCPCPSRMAAFLQASLTGTMMTPSAASCFTFSVMNFDVLNNVFPLRVSYPNATLFHQSIGVMILGIDVPQCL